MAMWLGVAIGLVVLAVIVYLVGKAELLRTTADALQREVQQFKEKGFDELVERKLRPFSEAAERERKEREYILRDLERKRTEYADQVKRDTDQINESVGSVKTKIDGLTGLETKVSELNDLLKPQQLRGELGEVIFKTLISDKLPPGAYEEDHIFSDGKRVEFVIRLNEKLIPVDSKFQLEDFKRLREASEDKRQTLRTEFKRKIKQKIDEVHAYIKPQERTYNFALMGIPSEAVYYELIGSPDFLETGSVTDYARAQNVMLVSPLTFWAYLEAIAQGLHGLEVGKRADEILASLKAIASSVRNLSETEFSQLGTHLRNATSKYDETRSLLYDAKDRLTALDRLKG